MSKPFTTACASVSSICPLTELRLSSAGRGHLPWETHWPDRHVATAHPPGGHKCFFRQGRISLFRRAPSPRIPSRRRGSRERRELFADRWTPPVRVRQRE